MCGEEPSIEMGWMVGEGLYSLRSFKGVKVCCRGDAYRTIQDSPLWRRWSFRTHHYGVDGHSGLTTMG